MRVRRASLICLALATLGVLCSVALAASGDPDPSFDGDGKVILGLGANNPGDAVAVQSDGKILVAGGGPSTALRVTRLNKDGSLDLGFGQNGSADFDFGQATDNGNMAIAPDGKIVLVGTTHLASGNADVALARANSDGTPDTTFGPNGTRDADMGQNDDHGVAVAEQPDGKVVFASNGGDGSSFRVGRVDASGHYDGTFNGGVSIVPIAGLPDALALQPDGKVLVAGRGFSTPAPGNVQDMMIARLTATGTPDSGFGQGGKTLIDTGGNEEAFALALQPDGKTVFAGRASTTVTAVARVNANGSRDDDFGTNGLTTFTFQNTLESARGVALQPDGKVVLAGEGQGAIAVARLQPGGTLDTTFSDDGKQTLDFNPSLIDNGNAVALAPDGSIVVSGGADANTFVGRLLGDPAPPGGGGGGGSASVPTCAHHRATIVGTAGRDRLIGTRKADVIVALGGKDRISGGGGKDIICGGGGNDTISGGAGNDTLYGQGGKDRISGGAGNDKESGGGGNDRLFGGSGRDTLSGGAGKDHLSGGSGKDRDSGGPGKDSCSGSDRKRSC